MKSGRFIKDAIILCVITLVSGICLGGVYAITKEPIQKAQVAASLATYKQVYADAAEFKFNQELQNAADASKETLAASGREFGKVKVNVALNAVDASGEVIGHIFSVTTKDGYAGGSIKISVGITNDGEITGLGFLDISETPGLGMNAVKPEFKDQYTGKNVDSFVVTKSGASADNEIDAISGATITTDAVTNAVNGAIYFANNFITK